MSKKNDDFDVEKFSGITEWLRYDATWMDSQLTGIYDSLLDITNLLQIAKNKDLRNDQKESLMNAVASTCFEWMGIIETDIKPSNKKSFEVAEMYLEKQT